MKYVLLFILLVFVIEIKAQTSTNSTGSGNYNATATWTSPKDLTGTANILNGHTVTVPNKSIVYSNKITFTGSAKLVLTNNSSKWLPATVFNSTPNYESFINPDNWVASSVFSYNTFTVSHYMPWIDSFQAWSPLTNPNPSIDNLIYDLRSPKWIQGIVSQGRNGSDQWVTSAKVEVSIDNLNWVPVFTDQPMNSNSNTKVVNRFPNVMFARYVKVSPIRFSVFPSMRIGVILRDNLFKSCKEIKDANPDATSGVYSIDPDGPTNLSGTTGTQPSTSCYCDMDTDGGGWTLVLNYLHKSYTYPVQLVKSQSLPLLNSSTLGDDESASLSTWGHVSNAYLNAFTSSEIRFYGKTSGHSRIMHFKTSHAATKTYFTTGAGSMSGIQSSFTPLAGHNSDLPGRATAFYSNYYDSAMTAFPFYVGTAPAAHWGIYHWNRWEMDDFPNDYRNSTHHQIWIR